MASFYEAPQPEELGEIYSNLAFLFRSQYIVTMSADVPADGTRYDFTLNVTTADGQTSADVGHAARAYPGAAAFLAG